MEDLMKKRLLSLALILVLTLICGVQIAADSAETYAMCNHRWATTYGQYEDRSPWYCYVKIYEGTIKTCELCDAIQYHTSDRVLIREYFEHEAEVDRYGKLRCKHCYREM